MAAARVWMTVLMVTSVFGALWPVLAHAQVQAPTAAVTWDKYPEVTVSVLCPNKSDTCICRKQDGIWLLEEDGKPQSIERVVPRQVRPKTETTFFLDLYRNQDFVRGDVGKAIEQLIALSKHPALFELDRDYFTVIAPGAVGADTVALAEKSDDLGALFNHVTQLNVSPYADLAETPLSLLLLRALEKIPPSDAETRRSLVVISDGNDRQTGKFLNAVISAASAKQILVHTVYVPTSPGNKDNLKSLADGTGGRFFDALDQVSWSVLAGTQRVCDLTYRSENAKARRIAVTQLGGDLDVGGRNVSVGELQLDVSPPRVEVIGPAQDAALLLTDVAGDSGQTPPELTIRWDLAPFTNRRLRSLGYDIPGVVPPIREEIEQLSVRGGVATFALRLENLVAGAYTIRAWVEDELGLRGEASTPLAIAATPVPSPTPTPAPTQTPLPPPTIQPPPLELAIAWTSTDFPYRRLLLTTALTSLVLAFAAVLLWRKVQEKKASRTPSTYSPSSPKQATAILHRVNSTVDTGVKQVIKLSDRVLTIPADLYLNDGRNRRRKPNEKDFNFKAVIKARLNGGYDLEPLGGEIWVIPMSGPMSGQRVQIKELYPLQNRCEIIFGNPDSKDSEAIRYRYVKIDEASEQNGAQTGGGQSTQ